MLRIRRRAELLVEAMRLDEKILERCWGAAQTTKVAWRAGESKQVTVTLDPQASSIWNTEDKGWVAVPGLYTVFVGDSSRDLPLHGTIIVGH